MNGGRFSSQLHPKLRPYKIIHGIHGVFVSLLERLGISIFPSAGFGFFLTGAQELPTIRIPEPFALQTPMSPPPPPLPLYLPPIGQWQQPQAEHSGEPLGDLSARVFEVFLIASQPVSLDLKTFKLFLG